MAGEPERSRSLIRQGNDLDELRKRLRLAQWDGSRSLIRQGNDLDEVSGLVDEALEYDC